MVSRAAALNRNNTENKHLQASLTFSFSNYFCSSLVNAEIQVENHYNLFKRVSYYNSKVYANQLEEGQDYKDLKNVMSLVFVFHDVFDNDLYINNVCYIHEESYTRMSDDRRQCYVELGKYINRNYNSDIWAELLVASTDKEFDDLKGKGALVAEAVERVRGFTKAQKDRYWDDMIKKYELDQLSNRRAIRAEAIAQGLAEGRAEGRAEGLEQSKYEIALKMIKSDESVEKIVLYTGLSESEIKSLMN